MRRRLSLNRTRVLTAAMIVLGAIAVTAIMCNYSGGVDFCSKDDIVIVRIRGGKSGYSGQLCP